MFFVKVLVFVVVFMASVLSGVLVQEPPTASDLLLQTFLQIVVAAAVPILLGLLGALLRMLYKRVVAELNGEQLAYADSVVRMLVKAAEQYGLSKQLSQVGAEKKRWVIDRAEEALLARGIRLDLDIVADLIEAAVLAEINNDGWTPLPETNEPTGDAQDVTRLN